MGPVAHAVNGNWPVRYSDHRPSFSPFACRLRIPPRRVAPNTTRIPMPPLKHSMRKPAGSALSHLFLVVAMPLLSHRYVGGAVRPLLDDTFTRGDWVGTCGSCAHIGPWVHHGGTGWPVKYRLYVKRPEDRVQYWFAGRGSARSYLARPGQVPRSLGPSVERAGATLMKSRGFGMKPEPAEVPTPNVIVHSYRTYECTVRTVHSYVR